MGLERQDGPHADGARFAFLLLSYTGSAFVLRVPLDRWCGASHMGISMCGKCRAIPAALCLHGLSELPPSDVDVAGGVLSGSPLWRPGAGQACVLAGGDV